MRNLRHSAIYVAALVSAVALTGTLVPVLAWAQVVVSAPADTTVHVGSALDDLLKTYSALIGTVVAALVSWALVKFTGIKLDANARTAIETTANNLAGAFLVKYDNLSGITVDVRNAEIAQLANDNLYRAKDALDRFGLGVDDLKKRIVEKIGVQTAMPTPPPSPTPA